MTMSLEPREIAIVMGASRGIGAATARELARLGFHILAGVRRDQDADAMRNPGIEPLILDITNSNHIQALVARVDGDSRGRTVRTLVNNAGIPVNAPVETYPLEAWRRLFEVNLFGHIAVTQALLPALIRGKGRVVNISSLGGKVAMATYGPYAGTKFALEAASDALRREIAPTGVRVAEIEPGGVRTNMLDRASATARELASTMTLAQRLRYRGLSHAVAAQTESAGTRSVSPEAVAEAIAEAVTTRNPRPRYTVGRDAALVTLMARVLPDRILDRILAAALRPHFAQPSP